MGGEVVAALEAASRDGAEAQIELASVIASRDPLLPASALRGPTGVSSRRTACRRGIGGLRGTPCKEAS